VAFSVSIKLSDQLSQVLTKFYADIKKDTISPLGLLLATVESPLVTKAGQ
jgi:hypothetical protein